ncbi:MAG: hypothetical protein LC122_13805 [Chitinophagales bacterium]|nr:hypothetical protein [Chitinophagales bacterium]
MATIIEFFVVENSAPSGYFSDKNFYSEDVAKNYFNKLVEEIIEKLKNNNRVDKDSIKLENSKNACRITYHYINEEYNDLYNDNVYFLSLYKNILEIE